ncbi:hypothetical protein IV203_006195 [Nitzschia inconspicua]|uniref:Codanin-1 C-terminal domain-containing protein n=1 Tax=Nitzschia inconspicua TaxID=303405 RepID=A0A9K3PHN0_9STRA|nr:hypothetical protein IV203_006195 [Nitzschia inconspicua]
MNVNGEPTISDTQMATNTIPNDFKIQRNARVICPCKDFAALAKIVDILSSGDRTRSIIDWLNGDSDRVAIAEQKLLSCGKRYQCRYRYGTSFAILNAIEVATAPFLQDFTPTSGCNLESTLSPRDIKSRQQNTNDSSSPLDYDTAFPPLHGQKLHPAASNILVPPKTAKNSTTESQGNDCFDHFSVISTTSATINTLSTQKKKSKVRIKPQKIASESNPTLGFGSTEKPIESDATPVTSLPTIVCTNFSDLSEKRQELPTPARNDSTKLAAAVVPDDHVDRLVDIYTALIRNMLVPSTPAQIQLLLQMLFVDTSISKQQSPSCSNGDGVAVFFQPIFSTPQRCILFAQKALMQLQALGFLQRLSPHILKPLVQNEIFCSLCPSIAADLYRHLEDTKMEHDHSSHAVTTHAIFSLPFEHDRDSRHNYKTQSEIALYRNREESRDAFLSQLRTFMTAKSRAFLSRDVDRIRATTQQESRRIIETISNVNMVWFAQFFCELLLQVGLSPVEEMDQDLLSFVNYDKDRLQKLHSRMHGKGSTSRKGMFGGTRNGQRSNHKNPSLQSTPFIEALHEFPGYQEFFFLFVDAADSYKLNMHLSNQLAKKIQEFIASRSSIGLEKRMMDLLLLGRFLGYLIFSSHWHGEVVDWSKLKPVAICPDQGLKQLESVGLDLAKFVRDAWIGRYTLLAIPCVSEILKMTKWDSLTQTSRIFRQLLADLRWIQQAVLAPSRSNENLQIVSSHLETLFHGTVTLPKLTSLPSSTLSNQSRINEKSDSLDVQKFVFSSVAVNASSSSMEALSDMIMEWRKPKCKGSESTKSKVVKKLRPSVVTPGAQMHSSLGVESPVAKIPLPNGTNQFEEVTPDGKRRGAQSRLEDAFFHQHRPLKEICNFIVDQALKNLSAEEFKAFASQAVAEKNVEIGPSDDADEKTHERGVELSRKWLRTFLETKLLTTLRILTPPDVDDKIIEIAVKLSADRGMKSCEMMLSSTVANVIYATRKETDISVQSRQKERIGAMLDIDVLVVDATTSITRLRNDFSMTKREENLSLIAESFRLVTMLAESVLIPSDHLLRDFFAAVITLDQVAVLVVESALQFSSDVTWETFLSFLRLISALSLISLYGSKSIKTLFDSDFDTLLSRCEAVHREERIELLRRSLPSKGNFPHVGSWKTGRDNREVSAALEPRQIQFQ